MLPESIFSFPSLSLAPSSAPVLDLLPLHTCLLGSGPQQPPRQVFTFPCSWLLGSITIRSFVSQFSSPAAAGLVWGTLISRCLTMHPPASPSQPSSAGSPGESVDPKSGPVCLLQENPVRLPEPLLPPQQSPHTVRPALHCSSPFPCWALSTLLFAANFCVTFKRQPRDHPSGQLSCPALFSAGQCPPGTVFACLPVVSI